MAMPKVLVLDDDKPWLEQHCRELAKAGFPICPFQTAINAIQAARTDSAIQFGIIDHLLFAEGGIDDPKELQDYQGIDAIREIWLARPDLLLVFVTDAPRIWSELNYQSIEQGVLDLRTQLRERGIPIHAVILKGEIRLNATAVYQNLVLVFRQWMREGTRNQTLMIGRAAIVNINSSIDHQIGVQHSVWFNLRRWLKQTWRSIYRWLTQL